MKTIKLLSFTFLLMALTACTEKSEAPTEPAIVEIIEAPQAEASLYDRLGGAEGISTIVDGIIAKHLENPVVSPQFVYLTEDPEKMEVLKRHTREFLGAGTGGKES